MTFDRPGRLRVAPYSSAIICVASCVLSIAVLRGDPQAPAGLPSQSQQTPSQSTPPARQPNPFENVPQAPGQPAPTQPPPAQPPLQNVPAPAGAPKAIQPGQPPESIIES